MLREDEQLIIEIANRLCSYMIWENKIHCKDCPCYDICNKDFWDRLDKIKE